MLNGIDKLFTGEILKNLCDMGHGSLLAIVDANYPAKVMCKNVVQLPGVQATKLLKAVIGIFPIDHIDNMPVKLMDIEKEDAKIKGEPAIWKEFKDVLANNNIKNEKIEFVSRENFYHIVQNAYFVMQTGEERLYGNIILTKGVVN